MLELMLCVKTEQTACWYRQTDRTFYIRKMGAHE